MMIENIDLSKSVPKQALLNALKYEAGTVHITDIMAASAHLKEDFKYIQASYREEYHQIYVESFLIRIKEIRDNKNRYDGFVESNKLQEAIKILEEQKKQAELDHNRHIHFFKIYRLIAVYTTFILDEPIHPVGMPFPGGFKVTYERGTYYCPIKESQKDNSKAVCGICIAKQDKNV